MARDSEGGRSYRSYSRVKLIKAILNKHWVRHSVGSGYECSKCGMRRIELGEIDVHFFESHQEHVAIIILSGECDRPSLLEELQ